MDCCGTARISQSIPRVWLLPAKAPPSAEQPGGILYLPGCSTIACALATVQTYPREVVTRHLQHRGAGVSGSLGDHVSYTIHT